MDLRPKPHVQIVDTILEVFWVFDAINDDYGIERQQMLKNLH